MGQAEYLFDVFNSGWYVRVADACVACIMVVDVSDAARYRVRVLWLLTIECLSGC